MHWLIKSNDHSICINMTISYLLISGQYFPLVTPCIDNHATLVINAFWMEQNFPFARLVTTEVHTCNIQIVKSILSDAFSSVCFNQGSHSTWKTWKKWEYTWKNWKYYGILKNWINIMEKWHETWKNLVATKNSPLTPLKQNKIH